ncbi:MAG: twin-arginine translocase subunit TatB [Gammaproteobacteria bacterium]|nr:twin-arginine translocase subunit TatB [Gammaproteobacteria bacterium]
MPRIARTVGLWVGKMRGFVASVKADIDRELATEELKKVLAKQAAAPELEELIDEISGDPLSAVESTPQHQPDLQPSTETTSEPVESLPADDKSK